METPLYMRYILCKQLMFPRNRIPMSNCLMICLCQFAELPILLLQDRYNNHYMREFESITIPAITMMSKAVTMEANTVGYRCGLCSLSL